MEKEKYYTPELEEFYVGFQYIRMDDGYTSFNDVFPRGIDLDIFYKYPERYLQYFRVKYLDLEDIESLGWKHKGSLWFEFENWKLRKWKDNDIDMYYCFGTINMMGEDDKELRFRGTIKNKSELKKLMQQLNIK